MVKGPHHGLHGPSTSIDLDDGFGLYPFPTCSTSHSLSCLTAADIMVGASANSRTNSNKRYSAIPTSAIQVARNSVPPSSGSTGKRTSTSTIKLVGREGAESPTTEAARLGGRVVQKKVSGNWIVYDYSPVKGSGDREEM